jgi:hypothetical protein
VFQRQWAFGGNATGPVTISLPAVPAKAVLIAWCIPKAGTIAVTDPVNGDWLLTPVGTVTASTKQTVFAYVVDPAVAADGDTTVTLSANATGKQWIQVGCWTYTGQVVWDAAFSARGAPGFGTAGTLKSGTPTYPNELQLMGGVNDTEDTQTFSAGTGWTLVLDDSGASAGQLPGNQTMALEEINPGDVLSFTGRMTVSPQENWGTALEAFADLVPVNGIFDGTAFDGLAFELPATVPTTVLFRGWGIPM